jgi:hypothetical protein
MGTLHSSGQVILNADGKQYAASYQFQRGVFTVTSGSASRVVRVGAVAAPESLARTILKAMVRENGPRAEPSETPTSRSTRAGTKEQAVVLKLG